MVVCATARYICKGVCGGGLTSTGKVDKSFFICWNMLSQVVSHSKVFAPLSNLKSGFAFSARFGRNLDNATNLSFSYCTSFTQVGLRIPRMASHLSGLASTPLCVIIKPRNLLSPTSKTHFSGLSLRSCFLTLARTDYRSAEWCSTFWDLTTMSSTYTSMVFPSKSLNILSIRRW